MLQKKNQKQPNPPQNNISGAAEHKVRASPASSHVPVGKAPPHIPGWARALSSPLMSRCEHSVLSPLFVNEAERQQHCLMGLLVLKAFTARAGAAKGEGKMFLTKRSRSGSKQPERAPQTAVERRIWGESTGWGRRRHRGGRDRAAAGGDGRGQPATGSASRAGWMRAPGQPALLPAQPAPPAAIYFISSGQERASSPSPPPGAGITHSTASLRPCPAGPRRSPAAPPTWLRAAAPRPPHANRMQMSGRERAPGGAGTEPGPGGSGHAGKGSGGAGKRARVTRAGARAVCKSGRVGGAAELCMQTRPGGRGSRALYANEIGRAVGGARGEVGHARHANETGGGERGAALAHLCKFRRAMQIK